jgi:hypothetical protein
VEREWAEDRDSGDLVVALVGRRRDLPLDGDRGDRGGDHASDPADDDQAQESSEHRWCLLLRGGRGAVRVTVAGDAGSARLADSGRAANRVRR